MNLRIIFTFLTVSALATFAGAQTPMSGTEQCGKPAREHTLQIGDRPNHSFTIDQGKCTWVKPVRIAGIESKEGDYWELAETIGDHTRYRFYYVDTMANGDKAWYRGEGTMTVKNGVLQSSAETWNLVGGTGKLKGLKGKGTNTFKSAAADGTTTWDTVGEYRLPE
jgi:hypothetical protein